jgi:hypothetical protein
MLHKLTLLTLTTILMSCGTLVRPAATSSLPEHSYIVLRDIQINSNVNFAEEGLAIFVRVTSTSNYAVGALTRYPEDGVVLSLDQAKKHVLVPRIQIPNQKDINVEVSVIAVPKDISHEGLHILGFAFVEIVSLVVPGGKIGTAIKYGVERVTDETKATLQEGRLVGYRILPVQELATSRTLTTSDFTVGVDVYGNADPSVIVVAPPSSSQEGPILQTAVPLSPGVYSFNVAAKQGWQNTGIALTTGNTVSVEYVSGVWFEDPPGVWHDASGGPNPWICSASLCHEPLHDFPKYALIGKVGEQGTILKIGNLLEFAANRSDKLYLRANYGDVDIPIHNIQGAITVRISVR